MSPDNPETWHVHPRALKFISTPEAVLALAIGIVVIWLAVSWWTDWRWRH
jgi:hypothetical protein